MSQSLFENLLQSEGARKAYQNSATFHAVACAVRAEPVGADEVMLGRLVAEYFVEPHEERVREKIQEAMTSPPLLHALLEEMKQHSGGDRCLDKERRL